MTLDEEEARRGVIRHWIPRDRMAARRACVWCGKPTTVMAETPFAPQVGQLPLMLTCGMAMRAVWRKMQERQVLDSDEVAAVGRFGEVLRRLTAGKP